MGPGHPGVPHYLRQIEPGLSAAQNIDRICFTKDGLLADEFIPLTRPTRDIDLLGHEE